jgi:hypothetical protein
MLNNPLGIETIHPAKLANNSDTRNINPGSLPNFGSIKPGKTGRQRRAICGIRSV